MLPPRRSFPASEAVAAFRHMAQARHIGKIVLVFDTASRPAAEQGIRAERTYLVTGGLGALGMSVARSMVEAGARHVVLASRSQPSANRQELRLQHRGARVTVSEDVSRREDGREILATDRGGSRHGGIVPRGS